MNVIKPIEWKQYEGETVNTKLIIRKGQRIQETAFYEDRAKVKARGNAYCIGNGPSRKAFDLNTLKSTGQTYGCNALYRDFIISRMPSISVSFSSMSRSVNSPFSMVLNTSIIDSEPV